MVLLLQQQSYIILYFPPAIKFVYNQANHVYKCMYCTCWEIHIVVGGCVEQTMLREI
jgi:hypothetical protein